MKNIVKTQVDTSQVDSDWFRQVQAGSKCLNSNLLANRLQVGFNLDEPSSP